MAVRAITVWCIGVAASTTPSGAAPKPLDVPSACLESGDGYLRARLGGAIEEHVDWPNAGTRCEGEERPKGDGIRLSFKRLSAGSPSLVFVFGIGNLHEGQSAKGLGANLTIIEEGTGRIFGTQGDARCTIDSLRQTRLSDAPPVPLSSGAKPRDMPGAMHDAPPAARDAQATVAPGALAALPPTARRYRVEARGFCTQPAHAVHGEGSVLASTFDFAGLVLYDHEEHTL